MSTPEASTVTLRAALRQCWRRERAEKTSFAAALRLMTMGWEFLRDSFPDRARQRYGDTDYDWEHRVDTTGAALDWHTRLLGLLNSPYQPIPPGEFQQLMAELAIDFGQFTFIDIGSGKGRALLLASEWGFSRIIGVELLTELHQVAEQNVRNYRGGHNSIELVNGDATEFRFPASPAVVFLFNPLPEPGLRKLMTSLEKSLREAPREIYIAYANPVLEEVVASCSSLIKLSGTIQYSLFRSRC